MSKSQIQIEEYNSLLEQVTQKIYRIDIIEASARASGTTSAMYPNQITAMILEREVQTFIEQLQEAGTRFVEALKEGQETLSDQIELVQEIVQQSIEAAEEARIAAEEAASAAQDAASFAEEAIGH